MTTQRDFDYAHLSFVGENNYVTRHGRPLTRREYVDYIDSLWSDIGPELRPNLQRRKDRRSLGEFALQVHDCTIREKFLLDEWLKSTGRGGVTIEDCGIANDGRLVLKPDGIQGRPDYYVTSPKGRWKLEVKFCPVQYKLTFKVHDLKSYARENALVLLIMGETKMIGPNGNPDLEKRLEVPDGIKWCMFRRDTIRRMLTQVPIKLHAEVGGKPSIQLRGKDIARFLKVREWNYGLPQMAE